MEGVLLPIDEHSEQLQVSVEAVELAQAVGRAVEQLQDGKVLRRSELGKLDRPESLSFCGLQKQVIQYSSVMVLNE